MCVCVCVRERETMILLLEPPDRILRYSVKTNSLRIKFSYQCCQNSSPLYFLKYIIHEYEVGHQAPWLSDKVVFYSSRGPRFDSRLYH